nr:hypothetical protein [Kitasatospora phosalacinea]
MTEGTVKSHFNRICHKLALRNRVDAVILAYETGVGAAPAGCGAGPADRAVTAVRRPAPAATAPAVGAGPRRSGSRTPPPRAGG